MLPALRSRIQAKKAMILGVGNPLRGDDGLGPALVERLRGKCQAALVNAEDVPENYIGDIQAEQPEIIVIVDAVQLGARPGDIALIEAEQLSGSGVSTHNLSLGWFIQMLRMFTGADVLVLAVQPATVTLGSVMSAPVQETLSILEDFFSIS